VDKYFTVKMNYKTGKLPPNFIILGILLVGIGIWRMIVMDWLGILLFVTGLVLFFTRFGVIIDAEGKRLKKYIGFLGINSGKWENINSVQNLKILKKRENQTMGVLSISRTTAKDIYKILLVLPRKKIEIMSGERDTVFKRAEKIASYLDTSISTN